MTTKALEPTAVLDGEIRAKKAEIGEFDRDTKKVRRTMVGELRRLEQRRKSLRSKSPKREITAAKQAGKKNIQAVRAALGELGGKATQAALGEKSGVGTGSLTWAIRALEETGEIKPTWLKERGSREFAIVAKKARTLKPGEGKA